MQTRIAPQQRSIYDPKYSPTTGRQASKTVAPSYIGWDFAKNPFPEEKPVYTAEQHQAFAAAIEGLCVQYPVYGWNRGARKRTKVRFAAVKFAKDGHKDMAFSRAIYGGIPKDALRAVETLIFG